MTHPLEIEVRAHVIDYLVGDLTLDDLKDWLVGETWGITETDDSAGSALAFGAMLALAEAGDSEQAIKESIRPLVTDVKHVDAELSWSVSGSGTETVLRPFQNGQGPVAGRLLGAVFA